MAKQFFGVCVKINEPYIHTDDLFLKVCVASIRPHRVPNHVYYLTPLIQYHGLVWPVDVWSADNIELMIVECPVLKMLISA